MNTEEFIDFKVLCYLSSNLISHCFYNIWTRRRNAGINNKRDIKKKKLPFPNMFCQMLVWFLDSNEHFFGLGIGPSEACVSEDIHSANHNLYGKMCKVKGL